MGERRGPDYGTPNWEMIGRWLELAPDQDGPFWALNLMKYRAIAQYADGCATVSGREADDAYAPLGPLAAIGAMVAFHADVEEQFAGEPNWDRVGIVRYPSRSAFFAMQQRDDFKRQHVHKEAGMDVTVVMSCLPSFHADAAPNGAMLLLVERGGTPLPTRPGVRPFARFQVDGVIVGDERRWDRVELVWAEEPARLQSEARASEVDGLFSMTLRPSIDRVVDSIVTATDLTADHAIRSEP